MPEPTDPKSPPPPNTSEQKTPQKIDNSDVIERLKYIEALGQKQIDLADTTLEKKIAELEKNKEILNYVNLQIASLKQKENLNIQLNDKEKKTLDYLLEQQKSLADLNKLTEKELDNKTKLLNKEKDLGDAIGSSATGMLGLNKGSSTLLGSMILLAGQGGSVSSAFAQAGEKLAQALKPANVLASIVSGIVTKSLEMYGAYDKTFASFEKTAGGVDAFKGRIENLRDSNVEYAVSIEDAGKAYSDLKVNFAGFAGVSKTTQDQLANTTAQMEKLGVSSSETIKIQNMLVKGFQMTGEQAGNLQKQLMATAKSMGLPMQKVVGEFANASNGLKGHGANMQKVFLDLQNQSKNLGIEFKKLQDLTQKFDTFEGAADSAGQLNAILGGDYLNSLDMVNADEGERIRLMQEALKASGKSYEMMSKQEKMAVAQSLGIQDLNELQQLMNNEVQQGSVEALNKAEAEKELAQSVQDVTTMQEKLTAIMAQFSIVLIPVLDGIKWFLTQLGELMSKYAPVKYAIIGITLAIVALFAILKGASIIGGLISGFRNFKDTLSGTKKPVEDTGKGMANAISRVGRAASRSAVGLLAFGAAILLIGGGIALAAMGLAKLVMAFAGLGGKQILGAIAALIIAMAGIIAIIVVLGVLMVSGIGAAAALGILALGAAFLMMGAAVYLAADGIAVIIKAMAPLAEMLVGGFVKSLEIVGDVIKTVAGLIAGAFIEGIKTVLEMLKTLGSMSVGNMLLIGPALFGIAAGLTAIAAAGVGSSIAGFASGVIGAVGGMMGLGSASKNPLDMLVELDKVIKSFPVAELDRISAAINKLIESLSKSIGSDLVNNLKNIVNEINNIELTKVAALATITAMNIATTPSVTASAAAATTSSSGNTGGGSGQTNLVPVAIYIDSKKVGEILDPRVKQTIQDSLKNINGRIVPIT